MAHGIFKSVRLTGYADLASSVAWSSVDEVFSAADDHVIKSWNLGTMQVEKVMTLPKTVYPTDMDWFPKQRSRKSPKTGPANDVFVLGASDGHFYIISRNGRTEKTSEAHQGAVLAVKWNQEGSSFATSGEDGQIKIWSKSGMLRSILCQHGFPIYSISWGPNASQILFTVGNQLVIQSLKANMKPNSWKAHDGIILKVDWNSTTDQIVSGSEDCRYKVWDSFGRLLYSSTIYSHPITSVSWCPDGQLFAVGSYNMFSVCDKVGWNYIVEKPNTGSLLNLQWSCDGTQITGAGGNGQIMVAQLIDRWVEWNGFEAAILDERTVIVHNLRNEAVERLEFRDRVPKLSLGYDHLVVVTTTQCFVYSTKNFNTPSIVDLKEGNVILIKQCQKYFALVDGSNIYVFTYDARLVCSPKQANLQTELLFDDAITISNDSIAVRDKSDEKLIYFFDISTGKPLGDGKPVQHSADVIKIGLNQTGSSLERRLALLDKNKDLYIMYTRVFGNQKKSIKLATMVSSFIWAETSNILATIANDKLTVWFHPDIAFIDNELCNLTLEEHDAQEEIGKSPELVSFYRDRVAIRRSDGSFGSCSVSIYPDKLHHLVGHNKWNEAVSLCRTVKEKMLWACLAGLATNAKNLDVAEIAFSEIEEAHKVEYLRYIKGLPTKEMRNAEMLLLAGEYQDAEGVLLQASLPFRAIMLNVTNFRWERALELAQKVNVGMDIVLTMRNNYLKDMRRTENLKSYLAQSNKSLLSESELKERIKIEFKNETPQSSEEKTSAKQVSPRMRQTVVM